MFDRPDAVMKRAIHGSVIAARLEGAAEVGEEHLALALFADPASGVRRFADLDAETLRDAFARARRRGGISDVDAAALRDLGIDVDEIVSATEAGLGAGALGHRRPKRNPGFSQAAKRVLMRSMREVGKDRGDGARCMLLGLLHPGGFAAGVFESLGVRYDEVAGHA
ncbi:ATPase [Actinorhabdospora filicis]|uniref:ATPase n=1 Tax=Actinorhabdospora filicis TaxID=1785913 RepID=A0A9W6WBF0_9ACTN|nr:Clp protease N-terminal domain-containing protein [Actinorhabdospora filicis]GLZ78665.1 ATPase [Actinorhabdospora filicis]